MPDEGVNAMLASGRWLGPQGASEASLAHGANAHPDVILLHANGFHGGVYAPIFDDAAVDYTVLAPDLRGFGRNSDPAEPDELDTWIPFAHDVAALLDVLATSRPVVLAGHSLGAATAVLAASLRPQSVRALVLLDPVVAPPSVERAMRLAPVRSLVRRVMPLSRAAQRRRTRFASRAEAFASYRGRGAFRTWPDAFLTAYLEDGLVDLPSGEVELACAPAWEAQVFATLPIGFWAAWSALSVPVEALLGATRSTVTPFAAARLTARQPAARLTRVAGASHFLPMERADLVRAAVSRAVKAPDRAPTTVPGAPEPGLSTPQPAASLD